MVDSSRQTVTWWEVRAMQATNLEDIDRPDFVALDKDGQVVLIAEVKGFPYNFQEKKLKSMRYFGLLITYKLLKS